MKSARFVGAWCLIAILASLACSAPSIPLLSQAEPTSTPRPTRTSRPTFTPTPVDTPTPVVTATPTRTNTPIATNTPQPPPPTDTPPPPPPTNTPRPAPPRPTNTPAPPPPPTNTPAPTFAFRADGAPKGWPNCGGMGIFGVVRGPGGNPAAGYRVGLAGTSVPPVDTRNSIFGASADRNYEMNLYQPGNFQVVVLDADGREISPRIPVTVNFLDQCDVKEGQAGGQWQQVDFRGN